MSTAVTIILYTALVFATSAIGALTGIGGGVVRKPVFDAMGDFSAAEIAFLNVVTVLAMSLVSILKQSKSFRFVGVSKPRPARANADGSAYANPSSEAAASNPQLPQTESAAPNPQLPQTADVPNPDSRPVFYLKNLALLAAGSVVGGVGGELLFAALVRRFPDNAVKLVQNSVLLVLVALVLLYMIFRAKIPAARLTRPVWYVAAGLLLGILASFLGIGGGPMNLAVLMLMFSMSTKEAAYASLSIIMVSQVAKLIVSILSGTILVVTAPLVYTSVGFLAAGAVAGGFVGSALSKRMDDKAIVRSFNVLQIVLIGVIVYNIVRAAGG